MSYGPNWRWGWGLERSLEEQSGWSSFTSLENRCNQESPSHRHEWSWDSTKVKFGLSSLLLIKNPVTTLTDHMNVDLPLDLSVPQPGCWDEGMGQWLIILLNYFSLIKELLTHPSSSLRKKNTDRPTGGQTALLICFQHITEHQTDSGWEALAWMGPTSPGNMECLRYKGETSQCWGLFYLLSSKAPRQVSTVALVRPPRVLVLAAPSPDCTFGKLLISMCSVSSSIKGTNSSTSPRGLFRGLNEIKWVRAWHTVNT